VIVEETHNIDVIKSVLCEPSIYDRITADNAPKAEDWTPPLQGEHYIVGYTSKYELIGCTNVHPQNQICWEVHIQVLPTMRDYAHVFAYGCLEWIWSETPASKLVAQIPVLYPDVIKFAETKGFEVEGVNRSSHLKNGTAWDQVHMGLIKR